MGQGPVCSCGTSLFAERFKCDRKPYVSKNILQCELHALAYEIECEHRVEQAQEVIDPEIRRGHSNSLSLCWQSFVQRTQTCKGCTIRPQLILG